jgi:hypothetical protein
VPGRSLGALHLLTLSARFAHLRMKKKTVPQQHTYKRRGQTPLLPERTAWRILSFARVFVYLIYFNQL